MINFKNYLSDSKLFNLLRKHIKANKIDSKLIVDFRKWLLGQTKELYEDERRGQVLNNWLIDMAKHYVDLRKINRQP